MKQLNFVIIMNCFLFLSALSMKIKNIKNKKVMQNINKSFSSKIPFKKNSQDFVLQKSNKTHNISFPHAIKNKSSLWDNVGGIKNWLFYKKLLDTQKFAFDKNKGSWKTAVIKNLMTGVIKEPIPEGVVFIEIPNTWPSWLSTKNSETNKYPRRKVQGIEPKKIKEQNQKKLLPSKKDFGFSSTLFKSNRRTSSSKKFDARLIHTQAKMDPKLLGFKGKIAEEMSNDLEGFVNLLQEHNLTVSDSIKIGIDNGVQEYWNEIYQEAGLSPEEQKLLKNIINLKYEQREKYRTQSARDDNDSDFTTWKKKKHIESYDNIHFYGKFHPFIKELTQEICKERNINFTLIVAMAELDEGTCGNADTTLIKSFSFNLVSSQYSVPFEYNVDTGEAQNLKFNDYSRLSFNLNSKYWLKGETNKIPSIQGLGGNICTRVIVEHELTHLENQHELEVSLLDNFLSHIKKMSHERVNKCLDLIRKSHEYEADTRLLQRYSGAEAAHHNFSRMKDKKRGSPIHLPWDEGYQLSERAVKLYEIEQKMLEKIDLENNILEVKIQEK